MNNNIDEQQSKVRKVVKDSAQKGLLQASTLGIELIFLIALGLYVGFWIDKFFKSTPWFTFIFLCIGLFAGFWNIVKTIRKLNEK